MLYDLKNGVLIKYYEEEGDSPYVRLPAGITAIGARAFSGCMEMRRIILPEGIVRIGEHAFSGCWSLNYASMPESLEVIDAWAFDGCWSLREIELPQTMTRISRGAFRGCSDLREISLPDGLTVLEPELFSMCERLHSVSLPASLRQIGNFDGGSSAPFFAAPLDELTLRGRWFDGFSRALNIISRLRIHTLYVQDVSSVPAPFLTAALSTFARHETCFSPEVRAHYRDYLRTNRKKQYEIILDSDIFSLLCREDLIPPHHAWGYFSALMYRPDLLTSLTAYLCRNELIDPPTFQRCLDAALAHDLTEITALLLDYKQTHAAASSQDDLTL